MLRFEKTPESNIAAAECSLEPHACRVMFTPSPHRGIAALWFRGKLRNDGAEAPPRTVLVLKNLQGLLGGDHGDFQPVMRTQHEDWKRLPKGTLKLLPDGRKCLEWTVATPPQGGFLEIAFSYPYDLEQLKSLLTETRGFWRCDELGVTAEDRRILRISNCYGSAEQPVPGLYLLARQHAGETPGSWVLDGVLRELARQRIQFPVWCVPMVDVDGVCNGDYGKDSYPHDMNRAWGPYELMRRETKVISADIQEWRGRVIPERSLVLDFHAPGAEETGIYAYASPEVRIHRPECCIENWLRKLGKALAPYAQKPFIHQNGYKKYSAWGDFASLTEFCLWSVPCPFASFETSYSQAGGKVMKREDYQALGALMAQEILRYLQRDQD